MRKSFTLLGAPMAAAHVAGGCPSDHFKIASYDLFVTPHSAPVVSHCSTVWPNETPEIALFAAPPGCLFFNTDGPVGAGKHLPIRLAGGATVHWLPEPEIGDMEKVLRIDGSAVKCKRVVSRTTTGSAEIIIGEGCGYAVKKEGEKCGEVEVKKLEAGASCSLDEESVSFIEAEGWHRNLGGLIRSSDAVAFQWLPRELFAEPDELDRKIMKKAQSVSIDINIEHPSVLSPPQIVRVDAFPIPVHARVNPPKLGESHFVVIVPKAVWMVPEGTDSCAVESGKLADSVKLPANLLPFTAGMRLVKTNIVRGERFTSTTIPSGNPDDLELAVTTTAITATAGALAIILASIKK